MSTSSNSKEVLLGTAAAAAAAGAFMAYAAMRYDTKKQEKKKRQEEEEDKNLGRPKRSSLIYETNSTGSTLTTSESGILFPHNHEEKMRRRIAARVAVEEDNRTPRKSVTVRVPATSANVGPGCECAILISEKCWECVRCADL